jgi:plastocyanin domain-containing protein
MHRIILVLGAALALFVAGCGGGGPIGARPIHIAVTENGFEPADVVIPKHEAVTLVFTRTTDKTCATELLFPASGEKHDLPLNQDVKIWLPAGQPDTVRFTCGMSMVEGMVRTQ